MGWTKKKVGVLYIKYNFFNYSLAEWRDWLCDNRIQDLSLNVVFVLPERQEPILKYRNIIKTSYCNRNRDYYTYSSKIHKKNKVLLLISTLL